MLNNVIKLVKTIINEELNFKRKFIILILISIIAVVAELMFMYSIAQLLSYTLKTEFVGKIETINSTNMAWVFGPIILLTTGLRLLYNKLMLSVGFSAGAVISKLIIQKYNGISDTVNVKTRAGDLSVAIGRNSEIFIHNVFLQLLSMWFSFISTVSLLAILLYIMPKQAILIKLLLVIYYALNYLVTKKLIQNISIKISELNNLVSVVIFKVTNLYKQILLSDKKQAIVNEFSYNENKLRDAQASASFLATLPRFIVEGAIYFALFVYVIYFTDKGIENSIIASIGFMLVAFQRLMPNLQTLYSAFTIIKSSINVCGDLLMQLKNGTDTKINYEYSNLINNITLKRIEVKTNNEKLYESKKDLVLPISGLVKVTGKSGVGKSTLLDIIAGLNNNYVGSIIFPDRIKISIEKNGICYIDQNIFVFEGSIRENVLFRVKNKEVTDEQIMFALFESKFLEHEVSDSVLDTIIENNGNNLSGGQIQRLILSTIFLSNSYLILIDEGTSGLDSHIENEFFENLRTYSNKEKLVLYVSHNKNTDSFASSTIKISEGSIECI